ncbi:MAG: hypothetical protein UY07_C0007G0013 [Parcubacteria group bacterium GW2011_GWA1_47_8]|nr:MAG: hypothetical protein UY07_C0007G0013 [Parcubacteria group bacterium GW2011_GWA1_47_8]
MVFHNSCHDLVICSNNTRVFKHRNQHIGRGSRASGKNNFAGLCANKPRDLSSRVFVRRGRLFFRLIKPPMHIGAEFRVIFVHHIKHQLWRLRRRRRIQIGKVLHLVENRKIFFDCFWIKFHVSRIFCQLSAKRRQLFPHSPISSAISLLSSTAYSNGSSLIIGLAKPFTAKRTASCSENPRVLR